MIDGIHKIQERLPLPSMSVSFKRYSSFSSVVKGATTLRAIINSLRMRTK